MERGQTMLEVILVLPLLTFLLWGMWELSLAFGESFIARYAAYAAARIASVEEPANREQRAAATARQLISSALGRRVNLLTVTIECHEEDDGFEVWIGWWRQGRLWQGPRQIVAHSRLLLEN